MSIFDPAVLFGVWLAVTPDRRRVQQGRGLHPAMGGLAELIAEAEDDARLNEGAALDCEAEAATYRKHAQAARERVAKLKEERP